MQTGFGDDVCEMRDDGDSTSDCEVGRLIDGIERAWSSLPMRCELIIQLTIQLQSSQLNFRPLDETQQSSSWTWKFNLFQNPCDIWLCSLWNEHENHNLYESVVRGRLGK